MRIPAYSALLRQGDQVEITDERPDVDLDPITVQPPSATDVDQGFMEGITASETVELCRALMAWLTVHQRLHPAWHRQYRRDNPGGRER